MGSEYLEVSQKLRSLADLSLVTADNLQKIATLQQEVSSTISKVTVTPDNRLSADGRQAIIDGNRKSWLECPAKCGTRHRISHPHMKKSLKSARKAA